MIALTYCLLCQDMARRTDGGYDITGAYVAPLYFPDFPAELPKLTVVMAFAIPWEDVDRRVLVTTTVVDQDGTLLNLEDQSASAFYLQMSRDKIAIPGYTQGAVLQARLRDVPFPHDGVYHVVVSLDGLEVTRVPLYLVEFTEEMSTLLLQQMVAHGEGVAESGDGGRSISD